jgi:hypothetical protein
MKCNEKIWVKLTINTSDIDDCDVKNYVSGIIDTFNFDETVLVFAIATKVKDNNVEILYNPFS